MVSYRRLMTEQARLHAIPGGREDAERDAERSAAREPLWREVLGERLREIRRDQGETLSETARRAGISPQYLSEVERGRKEPSSEMIAAMAGALGTSLGELAEQVAAEIRRDRALSLLRPALRRSTHGPTLLAA